MFNHRIERAVDVIRRKAERDPGESFFFHLGAHRFDQGRFADAGLTTDQHDLTDTVIALSPAAQEQADLLVATDQCEPVR